MDISFRYQIERFHIGETVRQLKRNLPLMAEAKLQQKLKTTKLFPLADVPSLWFQNYKEINPNQKSEEQNKLLLMQYC